MTVSLREAVRGLAPKIDSKTEIRPLSGLRGIAALAVAMGHYRIGNVTPLLSIFYWKNAAVDLFFCLSGFTLCLAYRAGRASGLPIRDYLVARFARIYPLYFLTMLLSGLLIAQPSFMTEHERQIFTGRFLRQLLMINSWSVFGDGFHWDFPAWSVSIEFFCYLFIFPALFYAFAWVLKRNWPTRIGWSMVFMAASIYIYMRYYNAMIIMVGRTSGSGIPEISYGVNLVRGVLGFITGWLVYASYQSRDRLWRWATEHTDMVGAAVLVVLVGGVAELWSTQSMLLGFPLLVLGVSSGRSLTARFLSWTPVHYLGSISYSIYLLHVPWYLFVSQGANRFGLPPHADPLAAARLVGGLLVVAVLTYHLVEVPLRRIIRGALQSRPAAARVPGRPSARLAGWVVAAVAAVLFVVEGQRISLFTRILPPVIRPGEEITQYPLFEHVAGSGWSQRETWGIWSVGSESYLTLRLGESAGPSPRLALKGSFFLTDRHAAVTALLTANGTEIGRFRPTVADRGLDTMLTLPPAALSGDGIVRLRLWIDQPASPKSVGQSADDRLLGFALTSMRLIDGKS